MNFVEEGRKKKTYLIIKYTLTGEVYLFIVRMESVVKGMSIASDMIRGHTDTIILSHLLKKNSYGYEINKAIQEKTDNRYELKEATLYTAFRRLEQAGYITSYWGDERTGARRRYYAITSLGREHYAAMVQEWQQTKDLIDRLI
jgi:PadR family transcriptional regulator PadR